MKQDKYLYEVTGTTLIIYLPKELDHHVAGEIRQETNKYFESRKIKDVIFDYSHAHFMDSSGIGLIMGRYREVRHLHGNVYIVGVNDKVKRILDISGLYRIAKKERTIVEALYAIRKTADKQETKNQEHLSNQAN